MVFRARAWRRARGLAVTASAATLACAGPPPIAEMSFVTTSPDLLEARVIEPAVQGRWCFTQDVISASLRPPWRARLANYGKAIQVALESVPDANVLTDVSVDVRVEQYLLFQRICAIATGNAGHVE